MTEHTYKVLLGNLHTAKINDITSRKTGYENVSVLKQPLYLALAHYKYTYQYKKTKMLIKTENVEAVTHGVTLRHYPNNKTHFSATGYQLTHTAFAVKAANTLYYEHIAKGQITKLPESMIYGKLIRITTKTQYSADIFEYLGGDKVDMIEAAAEKCHTQIDYDNAVASIKSTYRVFEFFNAKEVNEQNVLSNKFLHIEMIYVPIWGVLFEHKAQSLDKGYLFDCLGNNLEETLFSKLDCSTQYINHFVRTALTKELLFAK